MVSRTTNLQPHRFVLLLLMMGITAGTAQAQNYAAPGGGAYVADGTCGNPATPCDLAGAVQDATDGGASGNIVYIQLGMIVPVFVEDLVGVSRIDADVVFSTYTLPGPMLGVPGAAELEGDILIEQNITLTLANTFELRLVGIPDRLELRDNAEIDGEGVLAFPSTAGIHRIQLGNPAAGCPGASPKVASIQNMRIDKIAGSVVVTDQCAVDAVQSDLFITNRLDADNGILDMGDNNLSVVEPRQANGGVRIDAGAVIQGAGTFFMAVDPASVGGPPNNVADCYVITGDGNLNMDFEKITDAGVCIDLFETGAGGVSVNRAGALFLFKSLQHNGTFRNEGRARTEFWQPNTITADLDIQGPGGEVFPTDGACDTGNESGVYFFNAVTIQGDVHLKQTDDLSTSACTEGLWFMIDLSLTFPPPVISTVEGDFHATSGVGFPRTGVLLDDDPSNVHHNLALEGDLIADQAPVFVLRDPFDASPLCHDPAKGGNRVIFAGSNNQVLTYTTQLAIRSVQIDKDTPGDQVKVDPSSSIFLVGTTLDMHNGQLITNGLLDARSGPQGNTVVVHRNAGAAGILLAGAAPDAYLANAPAFIPWKVKYTGNAAAFSGDEIPGGPSSGSGGSLSVLPVVEVDKPGANITLAKDITITEQVRLCEGGLDLGSTKFTLEPNILLARDGGEFLSSAFGILLFPPPPQGVNLLYFGRTSVTVGLEWPNDMTLPDAILDVRLDKTSPANQIDLRVGESFQINQNLDILTGTLKCNMAMCANLTVLGTQTIHPGGFLVPRTAQSPETLQHIAEIPDVFMLHGNYPNPFNPATSIHFDLPEAAQVTVAVVDLLGRTVMTLPAQHIEAGANKTVVLDATSLGSGIYLYRVMARTADDLHISTGRMTLIK